MSEERGEKKKKKEEVEEEEEEALKTLEIENGLCLVPRVKLKLTVYPSSALTLSNPIDEWKMKRALIDFLRSSLSLTLPDEDDDLHLTCLKDLKKRKRDDPVAVETLRLWNLSSSPSHTRHRLAATLHGIELHLQDAKFKLHLHGIPPSGVVANPIPLFSEAFPRAGSLSLGFKPSVLVTHSIFSIFGKNSGRREA